MRATTMIRQHPPTPPTADQELHYDLHRLATHSPDQSYARPGEDPAYDSPMMHNFQYAPALYPDPGENQVSAFGLEYGNFTDPGVMYYPEDGYSLSCVPDYRQRPAITSPPTPRSTNESEVGRRTRSGRSTTRTASPSVGTPDRVTKSPRPRRNKATKAEKPKTPKLTAPLSILTKDFKEPVRDMEAWVHRSAEVRHQEADKRNGYITRPMNSFMLYRSAFAERTKQWCLQNNHQIVSSVSGESWPLEPQEVRDRYNEYAKIERLNHQLAHPNYKFSPSKAGTASKKRRGEYSDEEESLNNSDLDEGDAEWGTPGQRRAARGKKSRQTRDERYQHPDFDTSMFGMPTGMNGTSLWEMNEAGKPLPAMAGAGSYDNYYPAASHPFMGMSPSDALQMQSMDHNSMYYNSTQSLLGLPGGGHHELFQVESPVAVTSVHEATVDPLLMTMEYDPSRFGDNTEYSQETAMAQMQAHALFSDEFSPTHLTEHDYKSRVWEPESEVSSWM